MNLYAVFSNVSAVAAFIMMALTLMVNENLMIITAPLMLISVYLDHQAIKKSFHGIGEEQP